MKFNFVAAAIFIGAVSAVTLKERVAGIKERAAAGTSVAIERDEAGARLRGCREAFGSCEACYERFPYCQSNQIPSMITW